MSFELKIVDLTSLPPADGFLSEREQAFYQTLKFPKRRTEWLGGRFALKNLAADILSISDLKHIEVLPQASGKPILLAKGTRSTLSFSITHSNGYAAAAISADIRYLGIDLEKVESRISGWAKDFFHPSELTGCGDKFLTLLWTQKEAVVKLLGAGLSLNSFDVRIVNAQVELYGPALEIYQKMGAPGVILENLPAPDGFVLSVARAM